MTEFIDRKFQKVAETLADADPRDLGRLAALCKAHQKRIAAEALRLADADVDVTSAVFSAAEVGEFLNGPR